MPAAESPLRSPSVDIDLSEETISFIPEHFIACNKTFPGADDHDPPSRGAREALAAVLAIPSDLKHLPADDLPISQFVALELPLQSRAFVLTQPQTWYHTDSPTTDVACLMSRPVPPQEFLTRLKKEAGQAWFDGCKSIVDPRYNEGRDRFLLWVLNFWDDMGTLARAHWAWDTSVRWVTGQLEKDLPDADLEALTVVKRLFDTLGWRNRIWGQWTHLDLATILSWQWLSDDHIDMLMADLSARVAADPELAKTVLVAPLAFSEALQRASKKKYTKDDAPLLARYEAHIKKHGFERLYFPSHVNKNHWITGRIDFKGKLFGTGDSCVGQGPAPKTLIDSSKRWLKTQFGGKDFTYQGDSMDHGEQKDTSSCGIITPNTIAGDIFGDKIWEQQHAAGARANCFIHLVHSPAIRAMKDIIPPKIDAAPTIPVDAPQEIAVAVGLGDHNFPDLAEFVNTRQTRPTLADLMNPALHDASAAQVLDEDCEMADITDEGATMGYVADHGDVVDEVENMEVDDVADEKQALTGDTAAISGLPTKPKTSLEGFFGFTKKPQKNATPTAKKRGLQDLDETVDFDANKPEKRAKKANGTGTSKSTIAARTDLDAYKSGALNIQTANPGKFARWKDKLREDDPQVEFHPTDMMEAKHSACGEYVTMGVPYQAAKWNTHLASVCPVLHPEKRKNKGKGQQGLAGVGSLFRYMQTAAPTRKKPPPQRRACPGLTAVDSQHIPSYLQRTAWVGGGGRALTVIAKEKFKKLFSALSKSKKKEVADTQLHEHRWRNDHTNLRVFSARCRKEVLEPTGGSRVLPCSECSAVLSIKGFKQSTRRPVPADKDYIYVNDKYRNQLLGELYARSIGLKEIIETADAKNTPCIKFAQGTLQGKYQEFDVFTGLVEAMVMKTDKLERGVGMQNFKHPPAWDELSHIVRIHSPAAARALAEHFPVRTEHSVREKEARQPRFPMEIGDRTFQLVEDFLEGLDYHGPVNLSCDDTKLFPGLRLYTDKDKVDYLVGGIDGLIRVLDPDAMKKVLADATVSKATKVRVWCLTVPLPGITPLVVAAMPIPNDMKAEQLLVPLEKILNGLLMRNIRVVSYACDGTEVERSVQRMLVAKADKTIRHTITSPIPGAPDVELIIGEFHGFPVVMIQDSKHALKTFRNNLFTGARLLTFGNFTAVFRRIYQMAMDPTSPLYNRDVNRLDRQDDPAATRLFCAETLAYLTENYPDYIGEIVYLFVFGELVDAYQNREISHTERIKMALRARYFLDAWAQFLDLAGYKQSQYFLSREAVDIARILIEGIISLIIVHRDHVPDNFPLLPWFHSSEPCEHTFGNSRKIVKDFTFLDFIFMIAKLRVTMRQAVLAAKSSNPKARAEGYSHTYYDNRGVNLLNLAVYPSDTEIAAAAELAAAESEALI
ncbi:hypothetical protein B0H10DRAFT_2220087 [Mycena sp. CBHHK59/15]|nr:hypothetical protein B0H10DRAFT_2220087 [Mycena sp. CBHHK59/15]